MFALIHVVLLAAPGPVGLAFDARNRAAADGERGIGTQNVVGVLVVAAFNLAIGNEGANAMTNPVFLSGYVHVLLASLVTGGLVMLSVSAWQLRKGKDHAAFLRSAKLAVVVLIPASILALAVGSHLGIIEADYQPMKIAAAEAQWETSDEEIWSYSTSVNLLKDIFAGTNFCHNFWW